MYIWLLLVMHSCDPIDFIMNTDMCIFLTRECLPHNCFSIELVWSIFSIDRKNFRTTFFFPDFWIYCIISVLLYMQVNFFVTCFKQILML